MTNISKTYSTKMCIKRVTNFYLGSWISTSKALQRKRYFLQVFDKRESKLVASVRPNRQTSWQTLLNSLLFINAVSKRVNYNLWHRRTPQRITHNLITKTSEGRCDFSAFSTSDRKLSETLEVLILTSLYLWMCSI